MQSLSRRVEIRSWALLLTELVFITTLAISASVPGKEIVVHSGVELSFTFQLLLLISVKNWSKVCSLQCFCLLSVIHWRMNLNQSKPRLRYYTVIKRCKSNPSFWYLDLQLPHHALLLNVT